MQGTQLEARPGTEGDSVVAAYRRLESWLEVHRPSSFDDLLPPARETQIAAAESTLGHVFPEQLQVFYRTHDGQAGDGPGVFRPFELLDLESALRAFRALLRSSAERYFALPIASDGLGTMICVELAGHPNRQVGAVFAAPALDGTLGVLAPDLHTWLVQSLEAEAQRLAG